MSCNLIDDLLVRVVVTTYRGVVAINMGITVERTGDLFQIDPNRQWLQTLCQHETDGSNK